MLSQENYHRSALSRGDTRNMRHSDIREYHLMVKESRTEKFYSSLEIVLLINISNMKNILRFRVMGRFLRRFSVLKKSLEFFRDKES